MGQLSERYQGIPGLLTYTGHWVHDDLLLLASAVSSWLPHIQKQHLKQQLTFCASTIGLITTNLVLNESLQQQAGCDVMTTRDLLKGMDKTTVGDTQDGTQLIIVVPHRITPST